MPTMDDFKFSSGEEVAVEVKMFLVLRRDEQSKKLQLTSVLMLF